MPSSRELDYERILMELHREEVDSASSAGDHPAPTSHPLADQSHVWPPPSKGMLEDNSFLYEMEAHRQHNTSLDPRHGSHNNSNTHAVPWPHHLVDTPKQQSNAALPRGANSHAAAYPTHQYAGPRAAPISTHSVGPHPSVFAALEQIEMLNLDKKQLKVTIQTLHKQLEHFHDVVGPDLDRFHTDQVKLREEALRLREELRLAQQREQDAKGRIKDLELALMKLEQGGGRGGGSDEVATPEVRLAQLQDAIAKAYLQRSALLREREAAIAMRDAIEWRHKALESLNDTDAAQGVGAQSTSPPPPGVMSDVGGSLSHWRIRGKEAELDKNLQQKETLIASLTAAAKEIEAVLDDTRSRTHQKNMSQLNTKCPGCGKGQWISPFCPSTGHPHAGFADKTKSTEEFGDVPPPRKVSSAEALASGAWRKVVEVETAQITFEEMGSGRIVEDLEVELESQYQTASKAAKEMAARRKPPVLPADAIVISASIPKPQPGIDKEMRLLLATLKERNDEIQRLKALLQRMLDNGGLAALPQTQYPDAAPYPGAMPPLKELPQSTSLTVEESMSLLKEANEHLNQRCAELSVEAQGREQKIALLTQEISRLRFGGA